MAIREGKWRCPYCASVNRGADLACKGCGATRDKDVSFFLEDDAPEVTDAALLAQARSGADWLCQFCQTSNPPAESHCRNCGAERGTSPSRPEQMTPLASGLLSATAPPPSGPPRRRRGCGLVAAVLLLLSLGFCAVVSYFALRKTEETVAVAGFEWERAIDVEAWRTVQESAWEGEQPGGAKVVGRSSEVRRTEREQVGTERVRVGSRDKGNGFFEDVYEDRPVYKDRDVYDTRVRYEIEKWVADRTARASGSDQAPRWPNPALHGREREARRSEKYVVVLQGTRLYRKDLPLDRWSALRTGQSLHAVIQGGRRVIELR
jgi:Zn-finger in Ran binding protein and others